MAKLGTRTISWVLALALLVSTLVPFVAPRLRAAHGATDPAAITFQAQQVSVSVAAGQDQAPETIVLQVTIVPGTGPPEISEATTMTVSVNGVVLVNRQPMVPGVWYTISFRQESDTKTTNGTQPLVLSAERNTAQLTQQATAVLPPRRSVAANGQTLFAYGTANGKGMNGIFVPSAPIPNQLV